MIGKEYHLPLAIHQGDVAVYSDLPVRTVQDGDVYFENGSVASLTRRSIQQTGSKEHIIEIAPYTGETYEVAKWESEKMPPLPLFIRHVPEILLTISAGLRPYTKIEMRGPIATVRNTTLSTTNGSMDIDVINPEPGYLPELQIYPHFAQLIYNSEAFSGNVTDIRLVPSIHDGKSRMSISIPFNTPVIVGSEDLSEYFKRVDTSDDWGLLLPSN